MKTISFSLSLRRCLSALRRWPAMWCLLAVSLLGPVSSALAGGYAAIAVDEASGLFGYGKNYRTREEAEEKALQECGGRNAKIVMWAHEGCIALAIGDKRGAWGTGRAERKGWAQSQAIKNCERYTENAHCVVTIDTED